MKRAMTLALCLTASMLITGCGQSAGTGDQNAEPKASEAAENTGTGSAKSGKRTKEDFDYVNILKFTLSDLGKTTYSGSGQEVEMASAYWLITNTGEHSVDACTYSEYVVKTDGSNTESTGGRLWHPLIPGVAEESKTNSNMGKEVVPYSDVKSIEIEHYTYVLDGREYRVNLQEKRASSVASKDWQAEDFNQANILDVSTADLSYITGQDDDPEDDYVDAPFTFVNNGKDAVNDIHPYSYFTDQSDEYVLTAPVNDYYFNLTPGASLKEDVSSNVNEFYKIANDDVKDFGIAGYQYTSGDRLYQVYLQDQTASSREIDNVLPYDETKDILKDILNVEPPVVTPAPSEEELKQTFGEDIPAEYLEDKVSITASLSSNPDPMPKGNITLFATLLDKDGNYLRSLAFPLTSQGGTYSGVCNESSADGVLKNAAVCKVDHYKYYVADPSSDSNGCRSYTVYPEAKRLIGEQ